MSGTPGLDNQLELGEYIILDGLGIVGYEQRPLLSLDNPVRLEALTDLRLFLSFGRPPGKLEYYYIAHVISANIDKEMKAWFLVPALFSFILMLSLSLNIWSYDILLVVSVASFLSFFRMRSVLAITVVGGRIFRFGGEFQMLERVAGKLNAQLEKRDAVSSSVHSAPVPMIFPPRPVPPHPAVKAAVKPVASPVWPQPRRAPSPAATTEQDFKYCHMCGIRLKKVSRFCHQCGERQ